ncbi:MAG: histidine kinase [Firmicutes bacterium]|nr:histidine kinase [Bacillota bacterium]MCL5038822.1 histidine kinase [Bacillota bacterium]
MADKSNLDEEIAEVERQLEDLRKRLPAHSLKVSMAVELDELEERLSELLGEKRRREKAEG